MMIPGRTLHCLAACICSARTLERVLEPAIADLQKEYLAVHERHLVRRASVLLTGYSAILRAMAMCALTPSVASRDERRALIRTIAWSCALTAAMTGLLMLPPLSIVEDRALSSSFLAGLIPQALPLAIPIGLTFGIAFGLAGRTWSRAARRVVLLFALVASAVSFITLAFVMPAGNQAYRESVARIAGVPEQPTKGPNEMTFSELDREAAVAVAAGNVRRASNYAWSYHLRFALSAASVVLAGFLLATGVRGVATRGLVALTACFAYWALIFIGEGLSVYSPIAPVFEGTIPVFAGAWLPNIVFAASTILIASSRSSRFNRRSA